MPVGSQGAEGPSDDWTVERAILLLEQALEIIDHWAGSPEIGARLQEIIEQVQELEGPRRASA